MTGLKVVSVAILMVIGFVTLVQSAPNERNNSYHQQQNSTENARNPKTAWVNPSVNVSEHCNERPCGWATYSDWTTRRLQSAFLNTCVCPDETYKCVRVDDHLSISSYVYKCRQNTTWDDIELPDWAE